MPTLTMPRLPLIGRERAGADGADIATTTDASSDTTAAPVDAVLVAAQAQRVRRIATIVAAALVVSAIASGAATVFARRYTKARAARPTQ